MRPAYMRVKILAYGCYMLADRTGLRALGSRLHGMACAVAWVWASELLADITLPRSHRDCGNETTLRERLRYHAR